MLSKHMILSMIAIQLKTLSFKSKRPSMTLLQITYAPHAIFRQKAKPVSIVDDEIRKIAQDMVETMYAEGAVGLGANMVGVDKQIIVVDLREGGLKKPYIMINPLITEYSVETDDYEESSESFPGISAVITRPSKIKVKYLDLDNNEHALEAEFPLARVIQHEVDYLHGIVYLDKLSKLKQDMLIKKMIKHIKIYPPHVHGAHCKHGL